MTESVGRVVDAHHHLWDLAGGRYPWLQGAPQDPSDPSSLGRLQRSYLEKDFIEDIGDVPVVASVHVEAARLPSESLLETVWLQSLADTARFPQVLVVAARLQESDIATTLEAHLEHPAVRGVRQMVNWEPDNQVAELPDLLLDRRWRAGLSLLAEYGLSFDLQVFPHQLDDAARVVRANPDLQFILNHGGFLLLDSPERRAAWTSGLNVLAREPNVAVKASGYASVDRSHPASGVRAFAGQLIETFGIERTMFASNFPVEGRSVSYRDLFSSYVLATQDLDSDERDQFFYANAARIYKISRSKETS